jgi:hypothetical protein
MNVSEEKMVEDFDVSIQILMVIDYYLLVMAKENTADNRTDSISYKNILFSI